MNGYASEIVLEAAKDWARSLKRDVLALWIAAREPRTRVAAKIVAAAVAAYALSPIDLIPDFIPVLGLLDDIIILPLGIMLAVKLIPPPLMNQYRAKAAQIDTKPKSWIAAGALIPVWTGAAYAVWCWAQPPA